MMGDFNAKIGKGQIGKGGEANESRESENKKINNEIMKLLSFCKKVGGVQ